MSTVLVENVKEESLATLRSRAAVHGWSLQRELHEILEAASLRAPAVDEAPLRGWGMLLPDMGLEEEDALEIPVRVAGETPRAYGHSWVHAVMPDLAEAEPDSLQLLEAFLAKA